MAVFVEHDTAENAADQRDEIGHAVEGIAVGEARHFRLRPCGDPIVEENDDKRAVYENIDAPEAAESIGGEFHEFEGASGEAGTDEQAVSSNGAVWKLQAGSKDVVDYLSYMA